MHAHIPHTCLLCAHIHWFSCTGFGLILAMKSFHCLGLHMEGAVIPCPATEFNCFIVNLRARLLRGPRDSASTQGDRSWELKS